MANAKGVGIVLAGIGAFALWDGYDKKANYVPAEARVMSVEETCWMEKREGKSTWTSNTGDCAASEFLVANHPKWAGYEVKRKITLKLAYVSPVDRAVHDTVKKLDAYPEQKKLAVGDVTKILVSKSDAQKTRDI